MERSSRFIRHVESRVVPLHDTKNQIEVTKCKVDRHSERGGIKVAGLTGMMGSCRYFLFSSVARTDILDSVVRSGEIQSLH